MRKRMGALLLAAMLLFGAAGCESKEEETIQEINPNAAVAKNEEIELTLYFGDLSANYLVSETRALKTPVNDRIEKYIIEALIGGPSIGGEYARLLNPNTKVVSISDNNDVITVVLSKEFLDWQGISDSTATNHRKQLGVYSIVNTLVETVGYSRVQLLVDRDDNGVGQRIKRMEIGFSGEDGSSAVGFLERNGALLLDAAATLERIFTAMTQKDYATVFAYLAYTDADGTTKPDEITFTTRMQELTPSIEDYLIRDVIVSDDGKSAVIMLDYTIRLSGEENIVRTNIPTTLIKENGVWKLQYARYVSLFLTLEVD